MSATAYIYGLCDPRNGHLRYIGKSRHWKRRSYEHVCASHLKAKSHKNHWIKGLLAVGEQPEAFVIEEVPAERWQDAEQEWIAYFRYIGADLTNSTSGGDGTDELSAEARRRIGDSCRGIKRTFSPEHKAKIAAANKAKAKDPAWLLKARENLALIRNHDGHSWSEESRQKASISAKARAALESKEIILARSQNGVSARREKYTRQLSCIVCESAFTAMDLKARYCGASCRQKAYRTRVENVIH